jgi:hypothetical protein
MRSLQFPEMWIVDLRLKVRSLLEGEYFDGMLKRRAGYSAVVRQGVGYLTLASLDFFMDFRPSLETHHRNSPEAQISTENYEDIFNHVYQRLFAGSQDLSHSFNYYLRLWAPGVIWELEGSQMDQRHETANPPHR